MNRPILDGNGEVRVLIHRVEDVTAYVLDRRARARTNETNDELRHQLERLDAEVYARSQELLAAKRELEQQAEELEQFAARLAHDIKNPLASLALRLDALVRRGGLEPAAHASVERMRDQVDRMGMLIEGLLDFARSGARPQPGARASLAPTVRGALSDLLPYANETQVAVRTDPLPDVDLPVAPGVLSSVVANLVRNAITALGRVPAGERRIVVRASQGSDRVRVEVEDTGPGIPPDLQAAIFQPYVRGPASSAGGLGIGLATVQRLVEAHGGRVGVNSLPGQGSCFWFELPQA